MQNCQQSPSKYHSYRFLKKNEYDIEKLAKKNNFRLEEVENLPQLNISFYNFVHNKTGLRYLHMESYDQNNTFCVTFKTPVFNSYGATHILEHLSLAGSLKYPIHGPFFKMYSRSVSTYMNAITYPEHTSYPFSTTNQRDFLNLLDVYLDCVFHPLLRETDFLQEGWRLEHTDLNDRTSPIIFKGVVFNEMKGSLSSNDSLLRISFLSKILPLSYPHLSGGHPLYIPYLQYDECKAYHRQFYHPSNACFVTYGSFPLESHLNYFNKFLEQYSLSIVESNVPLEEHWASTKRIIDYAPFDPLLPDKNKQTSVTVGFKLKNNDPYTSFKMSIISKLLTDGPKSSFYQTLIEPHIGIDYSPVHGHICDVKYQLFAVGLKGIADEDIDRVHDIVHSTLQCIVNDGIPSERVIEVLDNLELGLRHVTVKRGLELSLNVSSVWAHEQSPIENLRIQYYLDKFRSDFAVNSTILQDLIREELVDNPHKLVHIFMPSENYPSENDKKFQQLLLNRISVLAPEEREQIYQQGLLLKAQQNQKITESPDNLPVICLKDMDRGQYNYDINHLCIGQTPIQFCVRPTNGITYFKCMLDVRGLPYVLKSYLPLFCFVLTKIGAGKMDHKEFSGVKKRFVREMEVNIEVVSDPTSHDGYNEFIMMKSYSLDTNVHEMLKIWLDVFNKPCLNEKDVILTSLLKLSEKLGSSLSNSGHKFAMIAASCFLNQASHFMEKYFGLSQLVFLKGLCKENDTCVIIENLQSIASYVLNVNKMKCSINTTNESLDKVITELKKFIFSISSGITESYIHKFFVVNPCKKIIKTPFDVNFIAKVYNGVPMIHEDYASLLLMSHILSVKYLHKEIREKGGAYGSGLCVQRHLLNFFSYRDPNIINTLEVFDNSLNWLYSDDFIENDLEDAKVKCIGKLDHPLAPQDYGDDLFVKSITHEMKLNLRNHLFEATKDQVLYVASKYLTSNMNSISILSRESVEAPNSSWIVEKINA